MKKLIINFLITTLGLVYLSTTPIKGYSQTEKNTKRQILVMPDSNKFWLRPSMIVDTIIENTGTKNFEITIMQLRKGSYGFSVYGYGVGFPTYSIISNEASGGASGNQTLHCYFSSQVLTTGGAKYKIYEGHLPIHIYYGSERGDSNYLNMPIRLVVKQK